MSNQQEPSKPIHNLLKPSGIEESHINRRTFIKTVGTTGVAVGLSATLAACGDDENDNQETASFKHGVASGDPLADRIILWTRVTPNDANAEKIQLKWQIATDDKFTKIINGGDGEALKSKDFTFKVDATGLTPNTTYFYRFMVGSLTSAVGKTKTLPTGSVDKVSFAVFSCANYPAGYFNVYAEAAKRDDFDVAIHLGDYIYEYGRTDIKKNLAGTPVLKDGQPVVGPAYASENAAKLGREVMPETEIYTLADYRKRYAQYRTDTDLQMLHAKAPMIAVWDDHEITNDSYKDGAENHTETKEGKYSERKMFAMMAYHEWMPTRNKAPNMIFRSFDFGDLISLHMLDTRIYGRDKQMNFSNYMTTTGVDQAKFTADLLSTKRKMLGDNQLGWLQKGMKTSTATWQVLGQQVIMGRMLLPAPILLETFSPGSGVSVADYGQMFIKQKTAPDTLTDKEKAILAQPSIPYNLDAWDGYAVDREKVLGTAKQLNKNLVVLAGDTHNAWANDLKDKDKNQVGVEFATSSVSSPGFETYLSKENPEAFAQSVTLLVEDLKYANTHQRGYMKVSFSKQNCQTDWIFVDKIDGKGYSATVGKSLQTKAGAGNRKIEAV